MSSSQRLAYGRWFRAHYDPDGWFNIIWGVLRFAKDKHLVENNKWFSIVDAHILYAISQGKALEQGIIERTNDPTASRWETFFNQSRSSRSPYYLRQQWAKNEQAATDYGIALAGMRGFQPNLSLGLLKRATDIYRSRIGDKPNFGEKIAGTVVRGAIEGLSPPGLGVVFGPWAQTAQKFVESDFDPRYDEALTYGWSHEIYGLGGGS
jgi:hypothetical protein